MLPLAILAFLSTTASQNVVNLTLTCGETVHLENSTTTVYRISGSRDSLCEYRIKTDVATSVPFVAVTHYEYSIAITIYNFWQYYVDKEGVEHARKMNSKYDVPCGSIIGSNRTGLIIDIADMDYNDKYWILTVGPEDQLPFCENDPTFNTLFRDKDDDPISCPFPFRTVKRSEIVTISSMDFPANHCDLHLETEDPKDFLVVKEYFINEFAETERPFETEHGLDQYGRALFKIHGRNFTRLQDRFIRINHTSREGKGVIPSNSMAIHVENKNERTNYTFQITAIGGCQCPNDVIVLDSEKIFNSFHSSNWNLRAECDFSVECKSKIKISDDMLSSYSFKISFNHSSPKVFIKITDEFDNSLSFIEESGTFVFHETRSLEVTYSPTYLDTPPETIPLQLVPKTFQQDCRCPSLSVSDAEIVLSLNLSHSCGEFDCLWTLPRLLNQPEMKFSANNTGNYQIALVDNNLQLPEHIFFKSSGSSNYSLFESNSEEQKNTTIWLHHTVKMNTTNSTSGTFSATIRIPIVDLNQPSVRLWNNSRKAYVYLKAEESIPRRKVVGFAVVILVMAGVAVTWRFQRCRSRNQRAGFSNPSEGAIEMERQGSAK